MRLPGPLAALILLVTSISTVVFDAHGAGTPKIEATSPAETPAEEAVVLYNRGVAARDEGIAFEARAAEIAGPEERARLTREARKSLEAAAATLERAVLQNPRLHQAFTTLGFIKRRLGDYGAALGAYDRAIALQPHYAEALEYRAEALLGLGRIDDAKAAHAVLLGQDSKRAHELLQAMRSWIVQQRAEPGAVNSDSVAGLAAWVGERLSAEAPSEITPKARSW
jgi:tetratricopeptide (TPR) repeat protein